jgi:hypothetical protein
MSETKGTGVFSVCTISGCSGLSADGMWLTGTRSFGNERVAAMLASEATFAGQLKNSFETIVAPGEQIERLPLCLRCVLVCVCCLWMLGSCGPSQLIPDTRIGDFWVCCFGAFLTAALLLCCQCVRR